MKPIIFSTPMVRLIPARWKTQTRRVVKWPKGIPGTCYPARIAGRFWWCENGQSTGVELFCPYGRPGDELWVRETFTEIVHGGQALYRANCDAQEIAAVKWTPSIFMPRWACRLFLRIAEVRVERVQDITREGALAEGVGAEGLQQHLGTNLLHARDIFAALWDSINAKRGFSWENNPWVWVIVFEVMEK